MSAVRVELMASAVGKIGGIVWHHLYLVAAGASGELRYVRAGPQCLPLERIVGRVNQFGDALEDYEPPPEGPYGVITLSSGVYEPGGIDFDPAAANTPLATGAAAAQLWPKVEAAARVLNDEKIPYNPVGRNANWAIVELLRRCGVQAMPPPKRWAPGIVEVPLDRRTQGASTRRVGQAVVL